MTDAHHDAAGDDEWRGGEAELLSAQQRGDDDVATGLELTVGLHDDPIAKTVEEQGLLGLGEAELPRSPGVLERGEWRGSRPAVVARDEHDVRLGLGDACRNGPDADLGDQLHVDPSAWVRVLQVVDQLREILDRIDVVVGRWADQADSRGGVSGLRHPGVHLVPRELAALAGLGALGHLDLQVVRVDQVLARHAEPTRRDLLDRGTAEIAVRIRDEPFGVLPSLAGVRLGAQPVHRDRQGLVRLRSSSPPSRTASRWPRRIRPRRRGRAHAAPC